MAGGVIGQSGPNATDPQTGAHGLSQDDLYTLALDAGLSAAHAKEAAAIAMAESGGDPNQHNTKPPDDSYGLWQINLYGNLASRVHTLGLSGPADLYSPPVNARAMAVISAKGSNFHPWSTYGGAAYHSFLAKPVQRSDTNNGIIGGVLGVAAAPFQAAESTAQAAADAAKALGKTAEWVSNPRNWIRVAYVIGGVVVLVVGISTILQETKAGKLAIRGTMAAATDGASEVTGAGARETKSKPEPEPEPEHKTEESPE